MNPKDPLGKIHIPPVQAKGFGYSETGSIYQLEECRIPKVENRLFRKPFEKGFQKIRRGHVRQITGGAGNLKQGEGVVGQGTFLPEKGEKHLQCGDPPTDGTSPMPLKVKVGQIPPGRLQIHAVFPGRTVSQKRTDILAVCPKGVGRKTPGLQTIQEAVQSLLPESQVVSAARALSARMRF